MDFERIEGPKPTIRLRDLEDGDTFVFSDDSSRVVFMCRCELTLQRFYTYLATGGMYRCSGRWGDSVERVVAKVGWHTIP
jgi:hypothetical protein